MVHIFTPTHHSYKNVVHLVAICVVFTGAGIHVFVGIPNGSFPNNGLVSHATKHQIYRLRFFCRSDSMQKYVGEIIGLNGLVMRNTSFLEILNPQPGQLEIQNRKMGHTSIPPSEDGIYTCHIPLNNGEEKEINIGIYHSNTGQLQAVAFSLLSLTVCVLKAVNSQRC